MRSRPSSRILLVDSLGKVLLFRFAYATGALAGRAYWATPGGAVEDGETYEQAAVRELAEETGLRVDSIGAPLGSRQFVMKLPNGEDVVADERFYAVRTENGDISCKGWTRLEKEVVTAHKWWSLEELVRTDDVVFPEDLPILLRKAVEQLSWGGGLTQA